MAGSSSVAPPSVGRAPGVGSSSSSQGRVARMFARARTAWSPPPDKTESSIPSNERRRARYRRARVAVVPLASSTGAPRVRATTRSPNAARSSPKDRSTFVMLMGPEDTTAQAPRCHHAPMQITFLGGAPTVTESQYLLVTERAKVLIDCCMFQGSPNESVRNRVPFAFDPADLDAVLLTHAHLDHCGLLPLLVKAGYKGPIHATAGTIELATLVLLDSGKLYEEFAKREARWEKRHPDEVEADDRREADEYQAAVDLAAAGESGTSTGGATSASTTAAAADVTASAAGDEETEHVATTVEAVREPGDPPSAWPRDPEA